MLVLSRRVGGGTTPPRRSGREASFLAFVLDELCPVLTSGQTVVLDNLSAHKASEVREAIEAVGCRVLFVPPYSAAVGGGPGVQRDREGVVEAEGGAAPDRRSDAGRAGGGDHGRGGDDHGVGRGELDPGSRLCFRTYLKYAQSYVSGLESDAGNGFAVGPTVTRRRGPVGPRRATPGPTGAGRGPRGRHP